MRYRLGLSRPRLRIFATAELGPEQPQVLGAETVLGQPPGDPAVAESHLLKERRHGFRPYPVR